MTAPRHRWFVFGAMAGIYFTFGIAVTAIAPMLTVVREDLGVSRSAIGFALGAWALIYIGTAPIAGRFIDRFDLGWSLALGGLSVTGSLLLRSVAQGLGTLWLAIAFFGVFGPLVSASAPKLMATWFPTETERRRGVGFYSMAPTLGGTITVAVTNPVLLEWFASWREVLVFEAAIAGAATVAWIITWNLVERPTPVAVAAAPDTDGAPAGSFRTLLASTEIRLILVVAFALFFINHALGNWMPTVLEEFGGMSPSTAGAWVAAGGVIAIASSGSVPAMVGADRIHLAIAAVLTVSAVALVALVLVPTALQGPVALLTSFRGALAPLAIVSLLAADRVTPVNAGLANGLWFSVAEVGGVTGPLSMGTLADSRVGYEGALLTVAAVTFAGALVAAVSHRRHRRTVAA